MEDRIKRLEALLIATYSNPNNHLDMNIPGLDTEGLVPGLNLPNMSQAKPEPPRLTLHTPGSTEFQLPEPSDHQLLGTGDYSYGLPYFSPPSSIAPSQPASASDYFPTAPSEMSPWSMVATPGSSQDTTRGNSPQPNRTRTSSMSTSETSQDVGSPIMGGSNRLSIDTSGSTLGIPQIAVTSWDQSRPHSPAPGMSPAMSPQSVMDMDAAWNFPPELSVGTWSGYSSPSIVAPSFSYEDHLGVSNQSLPSHSRRSSVNSLNPDYDPYSEPKRRRATSDLFPVPNQFVYPESQGVDYFAAPTQPRPNTPNLHPSTMSSPSMTAQRSRQNSDAVPVNLPQLKDDIFTHTFHESVYPLFPIFSPQALNQAGLSPQIAQVHLALIRAMTTHILALRQAQQLAQPAQPQYTTQIAQQYFLHALRLHGPGKWDSLPGIQSGILLGIYILLSLTPLQSISPHAQPSANNPSPNLYLLDATIIAACLDLNLHQCNTVQAGSIEGNTILAAYVLDRTISHVRGRPSLLKDEDLGPEVLAFINTSLRGKVGRVESSKRGDIGMGRLWDWWNTFEQSVGAGVGEVEMQGAFGF